MSRETTPAIGLRRQFLALVGLSALAVTQPLLAVLGDNPTLFTFHKVTGTDLVMFVVALAVIPPLALWIPSAVVHLIDPRRSWPLHLVAAAALFGLAAVQWARQLGASSGGRTLCLALAALGFAWVYRRWVVVGQWAAVMALLAPLAIGVFVFASPAADVVAASDGPAPELGPAATADHSVVMVVLDELPTASILDRDGGIDAVRFPALAAFATDATWFPNYTTTSPLTGTAVPSLLTGGDPRLVEPLFENYSDNLFSRLAPTHHLTVFETFTDLCGFQECTEAAPSGSGSARPAVADLTDDVASIWLDRAVPGRELDVADSEFAQEFDRRVVNGPRGPLTARPERVARFVDTFESGSAALYYLHLLLPHHPFRFYRDGSSYIEPSPDGAIGSQPPNAGAWRSALSEQRHLSQASWTDSLLGEILASLKAAALYDDSLVVVVSDHGISFEPDTQSRRVTPFNLGSVAFAPLLVKQPGQREGLVDHSNVTATDVVPTIAATMAFEPPTDATGAAIGGPEVARRDHTKEIHRHWVGELRSVQADGPLRFPDDRRPLSASFRNIGPIAAGEPELSGLYRVAGVSHLIGQSFEPLLNPSECSVAIEDVNRHERPADTGHGIIEGTLSNCPAGPVVIAANGLIVAGSRRLEVEHGDGFATLLPADVVSEDKSIGVGVVTADGLLEAVVGDE